MTEHEEDYARWLEYWEALTPEQQDLERRMMALYADESLADRGWILSDESDVRDEPLPRPVRVLADELERGVS